MTTITSWSWSRLSVYEACPAKAKYKFIDKLPEPPSPAMERGDDIHKKADAYITGRLDSLPVELKGYKKDFTRWREAHRAWAAEEPDALLVETEQTWAYTSSWGLTRYNDWTGCWLRIKTDLTIQVDDYDLEIIDFKTGKNRPEQVSEYRQQLKLYDVGALVRFNEPRLRVRSRLVFLDIPSCEVEGDTVTVADVDRLKREWEQRADRMTADKKFMPTPSDSACRWCSFSRSKGGPCKY